MAFRRQPRRPRAQLSLFEELTLPPRPANRQTQRRAPRPRDPHAREFVHGELRGPWGVDPHKLEDLAVEAHARASVLFPFGSALRLAVGNRFAVEDHDACGCGVSGLHPRILHVKRSADPQKYALRVLHELAHALLREHYPEHTHADVWALTLMLAIPRPAFRHRDLARHVARWVADLRGLTARKVSRAAA